MIKKLIIVIVTIGFFASCTNTPKDEKSQMMESIGQLEELCFNDTTNTYDHKIALKTLTQYQIFIEKYPQDTISAKYLYLGGQLCKSIKLYGEAIRNFEVLESTYPNYEKIPNAKFLIGMIYENDIKDTVKAKIAYQEFIDEYPNNELSDDAALSIKYMSLSTDDLIKIFEENIEKTAQK